MIAEIPVFDLFVRSKHQLIQSVQLVPDKDQPGIAFAKLYLITKTSHAIGLFLAKVISWILAI